MKLSTIAVYLLFFVGSAISSNVVVGDATNEIDKDNDDLLSIESSSTTRLLGNENEQRLSSRLVSRKVRLELLSSPTAKGLTEEEMVYMDLALVSAYEAVHVVPNDQDDDDEIHMVYAKIPSKQSSSNVHKKEVDGHHHRRRTLRGLAASYQYSNTKYAKFYRYDYMLYFTVSCNCGTFWDDDRRSLKQSNSNKLIITKQEATKMATTLCQILKKSPYKTFRKVDACRLEPM